MSDCLDCRSAKERLELFVDRELSETEMAEVRVHLDGCVDCETCFDFQEHVKLLVRRKGCPELAPADLKSRILHNLRG
jgi:mycothiol system anti-sigma-R factor